MRKIFWLLLFIFILGLVGSSRYLVLNDPQRSDAILVLAGETDRRPARALELLSLGYAPLVIVDVPDDARLYNRTQVQIAQDWVNSLAQRNVVRLCTIRGLSTRDESRDAAGCLDQAGAHSVLLVTSDFHTRRALSIFRKELSSRTFSVAAAFDPREFGVSWWQHRQWAKVNFDECLRLFWWEAIDRWR